MRITPLHDDFGARIDGMNLTARLSQGDVGALRAAIDEYSVLHFPEQPMSDDAQLALTRQLGEPEENHVIYGRTGEKVYLATIGNVIDGERKHDGDAAHTRYQRGNNLWHSDSSFRLVPSFVSILHAYEVPGEGGETEFVSQRAAYARLDPPHQRELDGLHVLHDYVFSRSKTAPVDDNHAASLPPIEHKLVRTNPGNGRKNVYVGSHARSIIDPSGRVWSGIESRKLIDSLHEEATGDRHRYVHRWSAGDTVLWDNRCVLHRGAGYDANQYRRYMRQSRVRGAGSTLDE
ncbi:MAG: TauD/TfdA family dioxygenase [Actinomycetota bacterium]